jgi:protein involved in polysaccharide export with SLBB domain
MASNLLQFATVFFVLLELLAATGCSTSGGTFSLFPTGHFLMDSTKQVVSAAWIPAPTRRELDMAVLPAYYVAPGDTLLVEPMKLDSELRFPSDQRVLADGTIELGRFGRMIVAGQTIEQIEEQILKKVVSVDGRAEAVNVRLIDPQGAVYYVLGEVNTPGVYPLTGRETVLDGILTAGGISARSSTCNIILSRPTFPESCRVVLPVCYREITQLGDTSTNYQLMPGDRIFVATRTIWEELFPWNGRKTCGNCCSVQCACPDPSAAEWSPAFRDVSSETVPEPTPLPAPRTPPQPQPST